MFAKCRHKSKVNDAVKEALVSPDFSFEHSFEVAMEHKAKGESKKTIFILHHSIQCGLMDETLRAWAKGQKYIPWVAIAAQVSVSQNSKASGMAKGSFFTVLPLPIATNQPVHIHGLFSISPDRARLYQLDDKSAQDRDPGKWNTFLFQSLIPAAWTKLLCSLADHYPGQPFFEKWPQTLDDTRDPLNNALENVVAIIGKESLPLWPTSIGHKAAANSLLSRGAESVRLRTALQEAGAPIVFIPERLRDLSQKLFKGRILSPHSLCTFLRSVSAQINLWSNLTKHEILEYLFAEPGFTGYGGLDLFPFEDGTYRSVGETNTFVHRNRLEEDIFSLEGACNLNIQNFSASAQQALKRGCQNSNNHVGIRYRSARHLREYCMSFVFNDVAKEKDFVILNERAAATAAKIRTWISDRGFCIEDPDISCLWLLPVSNGSHRRIKPKEASSQVYFAPSGDIGDLMRRFDAHMTSKPLPLLDMGPLGLTSIDRRGQFMMSNLLIQDATRIVPLLQYLKRIWDLVEDITEKDRLLISRAVASYSPQELSSTELETLIEVLRHIPIFQKVLWKAAENRMFVLFFYFQVLSLIYLQGVFFVMD
jgi:sacsin